MNTLGIPRLEIYIFGQLAISETLKPYILGLLGDETVMTDETWHRAANTTEINPDDPKKVTIEGEEIALYNIDGEFYATHNICTHAFASMADGFQEGGEIECPLHEGRFDIKTGKALCAPVSEDLKVYEVKVENGELFVKA